MFPKPVSGTATEKPIGQVPTGQPLDWSRDGQHLLYKNTSGDPYVLTSGKIEPFTETPANDALMAKSCTF